MATAQQILDLRVMVNEPTQEPYTDVALGLRLDAAGGNLRRVAASLWSEKSARYSELVDVQEGSSKRSLSQLQGAAVRMASYYDALVAGETATAARGSRTRAIERP